MDPQQLKRATRALWIGSALAVVITVATAWWLSERHRRDLRYDGAVSGDVLVSGDGRTLTTPVRWTPCHEVRPQLQARESTSTVALVLKSGSVNLQHQCKSTDQQVTTTLAAPLGTRRLVDASTGATINPVDSSQLANPGYLPVGYEHTEDIYDESDTPPANTVSHRPTSEQRALPGRGSTATARHALRWPSHRSPMERRMTLTELPRQSAGTRPVCNNTQPTAA